MTTTVTRISNMAERVDTLVVHAAELLTCRGIRRGAELGRLDVLHERLVLERDRIAERAERDAEEQEQRDHERRGLCDERQESRFTE